MSAELTKLLEALPESVNPYIYLAGYLNDLLLPQVPQALDVNLFINMGLYSVFLAVAVAGMGLRWLRGKLWYVHRRQTQLGKVILPNGTALFALFSSIFCVAAIVDMVLLILAYDGRMTNAAVWTGHIWVWPWMLFAIWSEAYGMVVAVCLAQPKGKLLGFISPSAKLLNSMFLLQFPVHFALVAPPFGLVANSYDRAWVVLQGTLRPALLEKAQEWTEGETAELNGSWQLVISRLASQSENVIHYSAVAWWMHLAVHVVIAIVFLAVGIKYMQLLKTVIKNNGDTARHQTVTFLTSSDDPQQLYIRMFVELGFVALAATTYCILSGWLAIDFRSIKNTPAATVLEYSLAFYLFVLFGLPPNLMIAHRALRSFRERRCIREPFGPLSIAGAISVSREEVVAVDINLQSAVPHESWSSAALDTEQMWFAEPVKRASLETGEKGDLPEPSSFKAELS